eukprot:166564_1
MKQQEQTDSNKTKINMYSSTPISLNKNDDKTVLSWDRLCATNISKSSMVIIVLVYLLATCDAAIVNNISCDQEIMDLFEIIKYLLLAEFIIYAIPPCVAACGIASDALEISIVDAYGDSFMTAITMFTACGLFVSACLSFTVVGLIDQNSLQSIPDMNMLFIFAAIIGSLQIVAILTMMCATISIFSFKKQNWDAAFVCVAGSGCCYCVQSILIAVVFFAFIVPIWDPESIYCGDIGIECGSIGNFQNKQTDQCIKFINKNTTAQSYDFIDCNSEQGYWKIDSAAADDFTAGYFRIKNMQTNTCIINRDNDMFDEECNYDAEQFWKIYNQNGEWFQIQNKKTNYCIYQSNQGLGINNSCVNIDCLNVNNMCFRLIVTDIETCVIDTFDYFGTTDIPYIPKLQSDSDWSTYASIAYFSFYTTFMMILALYVYYSGQHNLDTTFLKSVWQQRKIYGQILAHFYDTATDLGVIITWYYLWQDEQNGYDYKSVDMAVFLWGACAAMTLYRMISIPLMIWRLLTEDDDWDNFCEIMGTCCCCIFQFILALLDMFIFVAIYDSFKSSKQKIQENVEKIKQKRQRIAKLKAKKLKEKQAKIEKEIAAAEIAIEMSNVEQKTENNIQVGEAKNNQPIALDAEPIGLTVEESKAAELEDIDPVLIQRICMLLEAALESMPQVVLQTVFLVRSANDENLPKRSNFLIFTSLISSVCSVASKFFLMDKVRVRKKAKSLSPRKKFPNCCQPWYLIRIVWRFCHIVVRFAVFSLLWISVGGAFSAIFVLVSALLVWFLSCRDKINGYYTLLGTVAVPITADLMHFLRWMENVIGLVLISLFAQLFGSLNWECQWCVNLETRTISHNQTILVLIIFGWVALGLEIVLFFVLKYGDIFDYSWKDAIWAAD